MKRFLFFAVVATLFAACSKDAINEQQGIQNIVDESPATLTVGFEDDETRIQLNSAQKTVWTNGDLVSVFYRSDANQQWQYTGETGARTAELKRVDAGTASRDMDRVVIVYPYNEGYYINPSTYNVQASLPAVQTYLEDSYGLDGNIMISQGEYNQFSLKSVCGWLKLQLTGNGEQIKSITVRGNSGEQVAGELYINSADATSILASDSGASDDDSEAGGSLIFEDTILTEVTLDCSEGVELGDEATAFYIALPPQTFENGFTVEIEAMDGHIMTKSTDKTLTIERNHIQPMTAFDFAPSYPLSNEIFYTASEQVTPNNPEAFGTTFISSSWDAETGTGVMLFEDELSYIGDYAFEGKAALLSVLLPNSVTEIRNCCFRYCSNLTKAVIPGEITHFHSASFEQCHALATINCRYSTSDLRHVVMNNIYLAYAPAGAEDCVIPDGVKYVESYVFRGSNIESVVIPASVNRIGEQTFSRCANLMAVYCKPTTPPTGGDKIFDDNASGRRIFVPASDDDSIINAYKEASRWSDYADYIFEEEPKPANNEIWYTATAKVEPYDKTVFGATYVSNEWDSETGKGVITFEGDVTKIGYYAFYECSSLTSVTIPDSVTTIGNDAFSRCYSLTSVTIPDRVTTIGDAAFYCCSSLTSVTIGNSVTTIGYAEFYGCNSLTSVTIGNSVTTIGYVAFGRCSSLTSVTIPDSVTTIRNYAFCDCDSLKEFKGKFAADNGRCLIKDNTIIAYAEASGTTYTIPDSVTTISGGAFSYCDSLTSVTIPDSVTMIGDEAFYGCTRLATVYCKPTTPPAGGDSMFDNNAAGRRIVVPASDNDSIINAYKAKQWWSDYADYIFEEE